MLSEFLDSSYTGNDRRTGLEQSAAAGITRKFKSGAEFTSAVALDLVKLLTQSKSSSFGVSADASISIPLLRGSGRAIVTEPLTQAERNMIYAINTFERFKRTFAVSVASDYFSVLQQYQQVQNEAENYKRVIASTRRARRLADSGRLPEFQFDQAIQDELRARNRWISARQGYERDLDRLKIRMGLPTDARVDLRPEELARLGERAAELTANVEVADYSGKVPPADAPVELKEPTGEDAGPLELPPDEAVRIALDHRADLRTALGRVDDAQRKVMVAADNLRAELTLLGTAAVGEGRSIGQADLPNGTFYPDEGRFTALLDLDLPLERTFERNAYRERLIQLERSVRDVQELEDDIKLTVRNRLRTLLEARESVIIQSQAVRLAEKRVRSTDMFLQAGRAQIRDVLEAQDALLSAQNALNSALVSYRIAELALQQDLGVLEVTVNGLWREYVPGGRG
jgi:outer membrane protein TolC